MNIRQAYEKYMTPKNLQEHMLRVASLSKIITDNWTGQAIDKLAIIKACTMHDIAKPVTFDTSKVEQAKYGMTEEDAANLENLQNLIKSKYGNTEGEAVVEMCGDIGMAKEPIRIIENLEREWKIIPSPIKAGDINSLIPMYCDMRIGPHRIINLQERFNDLRNRGRGFNDKYLNDAKILEQRLQENVSVDLNSVTEEELKSLFPELLNLEI